MHICHAPTQAATHPTKDQPPSSRRLIDEAGHDHQDHGQVVDMMALLRCAHAAIPTPPHRTSQGIPTDSPTQMPLGSSR